MWQQYRVFAFKQSRVDLGLLLEDVQARCPDLAALQRVNQGRLVNQSSSRCVHNYDAVPHLIELGLADDVLRLGVQRPVQTQPV